MTIEDREGSICDECNCNHSQVVTSKQECSCECHYGDLEE